jgi:hypothetical protein
MSEANGDNLHWFVRILLRMICERLVKQGPMHKKRITAYYRVMYHAARKEFCEDSKPTLDAFLEECHQDANDQVQISSAAK